MTNYSVSARTLISTKNGMNSLSPTAIQVSIIAPMRCLRTISRLFVEP